MPRPRIILSVALLLGILSGLPAAFAEGIYQWVDPAGGIIFGDRPPPDRATRRLEVPPAPSPEAAQAARERAEAVQRLADEFAAERRRREAAAAEALWRQRPPAPSAAQDAPEPPFRPRYRDPRWHPGWFWPPPHRPPHRYPRPPHLQPDPPPDFWPPNRAPEFTQPRRAPEFTQHLPTPGQTRQ